MGSIIVHRVDYNGVGALRGQRHIPRKNLPEYPPPPGVLIHFVTDSTGVTVPFSGGEYTFNWIIEDLEKLG